MDGVERVMVLGILAVIVAILSFAWSATDESAPPVGALGRDSGIRGSAISLSSNEPSHDSVILDEASRSRLAERSKANNAAREAQLQQKWDLLNGGQPTRGSSDPSRVADPHAAGDLEQVAGRTPTLEETPADLRSPTGSESPMQVPLKPGSTGRDGLEGGSDGHAFRQYTVVSGDTLWGLASRTLGGGDTNLVIAQILALNPELSASTLNAGQTIKLPMTGPASEQFTAPAARTPSSAVREYVVSSGDSVRSIATYELGEESRWKEIYELNKAALPDPGRILVGQRLILPVD